MTARCAHEPARRVRLQPALALSPIPDPILRAEHPSPALAVENRKVTYGKSERSGLEPAVAALLDQHAIAGLGIREWIDGHAESIANLPTAWGGSLPRLPARGPQRKAAWSGGENRDRQRSGRGGCRIP
jgi:hypothetical protein